MDGMLTGEEFEKAVDLALMGCKQVSTIQKETLKAKYVALKVPEMEKEEK
jgi:exosome complex component RRP41